MNIDIQCDATVREQIKTRWIYLTEQEWSTPPLQTFLQQDDGCVKSNTSRLHSQTAYSKNASISYCTPGLQASGERLISIFLQKYPKSLFDLQGVICAPSPMIALSDIFRNSDGTAEITLMEEQTLSIAGSLFNASAMDTLLGLLAGGWRGAPPFHISSTQFSGLELSINFRVKFVVLESSAIPLVDSIAIRWDSAEFVRKLGICAWIDEMRPTPALKNFVLQLPFWHVAPPSLQTVRSAPNYKPVGGDTHISFDESQHHSPTPASVATLFKAVGGIQTLSLSDEPPLHEVSPPYKAEVPWARPSSPEPSSGHANQRKQESHFTGSGFTERTPLEYVPGRRMMVPP